MKRLIPVDLLPITLWDAGNKHLNLPPELSKIYNMLVDRYGLRELANARDSKKHPVGGLTQEKTNEHFAQAFDGSVARTQLAFLDPNNNMLETSNAFMIYLAGGNVSLTDAPCGAGAGAFALLANIAELRSQNVLPRQPLDIVLIGAELSEPARQYAQVIFNEIRPRLEVQAIFVKAFFMEWDVTDKMKNTNLIKEITIKSDGYKKHLLIIANFNGFLEKENKRGDAEKQIEELFRYVSSAKNSLAIWIEPDMNRATENLFPWLVKKAKEFWNKFVNIKLVDNLDRTPLRSSSKFWLPLSPGSSVDVRVTVMLIDLIRKRN